MFELKEIDPTTYRRETRHISLVIIAIFLTLAMSLAAVSVRLFGEPGGNNLIWNLAGVLTGLALTVIIVRFLFWHRPWMAPAVYAWNLKRNVMRIGNVMHHLKRRVEDNDPDAIRLLRFYHLALNQMYRLDNNVDGLNGLLADQEALRAKMVELGLPTEQHRFDPDSLAAMKLDD